MKTPREILLRRHEHAEPALDRARARALAELKPQSQTAPPSTVNWLVLLRSLRWHLAGLSAAWLLVLYLNADSAAAGTSAIASAPSAPSAGQLLFTMWEHRRELLNGLDILEETVHQTPPILPPRRSELLSTNFATIV